MTSIDEDLKTRIDADWSLAGTLGQTTAVLIKYTEDLPPSISVDNVYIIIYPSPPAIRVQTTLTYEDLIYEGSLVVFGVDHGNVDDAVKELVRIGNSYSNSTGGETLTFRTSSIRGDRKDEKKFISVLPWKWVKKNQSKAT